MSSDKDRRHGVNDTASQAESTGTLRHVHLGYNEQLPRRRSLISMLGMLLAITAVPFGLGSPLISAIYAGGQLSLFVGLIVVLILDGCVAVSLAELASRYPTSSGIYYWSYRLAPSPNSRKALSFLTGWLWLIGNWTITLSVNFGFASLIAATVTVFYPDWIASSWELLLIFYAICLLTLLICAAADHLMPIIDTVAAIWNAITIIAVLIAVCVTAKAGRHDAAFALGNFDGSLSGWGRGFSFFIGLLPPSYVFSAMGMITSMAEECHEPETEVPNAMTLCVPIGGIASLFFVLPLCFTLPPLEEILEAPYGQALPFVLEKTIGSKAVFLVVMVMVFLVTLFCSLSITTTASRYTWAFSRDKAIPMHHILVRTVNDQPLYALILVTLIQMLLGLINLGSTSAFTAFVSVGVTALAVSYLVPISISLASGRKEVSKARWHVSPVLGMIANVVSICWILLELVLFSMPTVLPVTAASMNYSSVVLVGFGVISATFYLFSGRNTYHGPPEESTS